MHGVLSVGTRKWRRSSPASLPQPISRTAGVVRRATGAKQRPERPRRTRYSVPQFMGTGRPESPPTAESALVQAAVRAREGPSTASPGFGLPLPVQPAGPGPLGIALPSIHNVLIPDAKIMREVNVSIHSRFATSPYGLALY